MTGTFMASIAIKATVILALGLGAHGLLRHTRAAVRHLLLLAACAAVLALPFVALVLPVWAVPVPGAVGAIVSAPTESLIDATLAPPIDAPVIRPAMESATTISIPTFLLLVEATGVTLALLPLIAGLWETHRLCRGARPWVRGRSRIEALVTRADIRRPVDVLIHDDLAGPVTCGMWRPVLLFPAAASRWDDADLERAAIHELEHVRRNDWATDAFARGVCALYWFHPLAWTTWRQLRLESEHAADDAVVRECEAAAYADLLVRLAQRLVTEAPHPAMAMANRRDLPTRVRALLDPARPRQRAGRRCGVMAALVTAVVVFGIGPLAPALDVRVAAAGQASRNVQPVTVPQPAGRPTFEVASIKQDLSVGQLSSMNAQPGGRMVVTNHTLLNIVRQVHRLQRYQIVGGPDWVDRDRWDILAKAATDAPFAQMVEMMDTLLADRFKLVAHHETREMPVYALVMTRADGRLGPQVKASTVDCDAIAATAKSGPPPAPGEGPRCGININNNVLRMSAMRMSDLARNLSIMTDRFVVDKTGLSGIYDLELQWNNADGPSLPTAVQEQLGLRLEPQRADVDVLVIDSAERPASD